MPVIERGARAKTFTFALESINSAIARSRLGGPKKYFTKTQAKNVWNRYKGACAYCEIPLVPRGGKEDSLHFTMYVPLKHGGRVEEENLLPVCKGCKERHKLPPKRMLDRIPNVNTIADLVDRLIVEVHKLAWFENKKREEHAKTNPDIEKIAMWDNASRDCCELRSLLKRELNTAFEELVVSLQYVPRKEARTFRPPKIQEGFTLGDLIMRMCDRSAQRCFESPDVPPEDDGRNAQAKWELAEILKAVQLTGNYHILRDPDAG
jgi:5-methylcytosine-specific restriction endonuclease McrA